jgi:hypothetical protein
VTEFDIVFVADARFEGGSSTALLTEMKVAARLGLRLALMLVKGPLLGLPFPVHPHIRRLLDDGLVTRLDPETPAKTEILLIHHPTIMENRPTRPLQIEAKRVVMVLHHPVFDRAGKRYYDLEKVVRNCADAFWSDIWLAPVSPVVRQSLPSRLPARARLLEIDWDNLIDPDDWPQRPVRPPDYPVTIGRHARPDPLKWPNTRKTALQAYPDNADCYLVRILGGGDFLEALYGPLPGNWDLLPFAWDGTSDFLHSLDFYVYFHSDEWSEAFGRTILEALASGLVTILPAHFESLFGPAAIYCEPEEVEAVIARFVADPLAYAEQAARARAHVEAHHAPDRLAERLQQIGFTATQVASAVLPSLPERSVLFVSSNGIGVGHLAQQLAIARRLPPALRSVFATMCYSLRVAADAGYLTHFLTYHRHIDADAGDWNRVLAEELFDLIVHTRTAVFAYDATSVFSGVLDALESHPDVFSVWVRRPMWREVHRRFLESSSRFDAVIEPGELAEDFDTGPTAAKRSEVLLVPPVLHMDPSERLDRNAARQALNLPEETTVVALQLGSGANFDMRGVRRAIVAALLARPDTIVLDIRSPLAASEGDGVAPDPRLRVTTLFPSFRYSLAFDAAVSAVGYNTFHEQILGAIPTLFVPNEAPEMDRQLARARWAELTGRALLMRRDHDLHRARSLVERLLDPAERARMTTRCKATAWTNGAIEIARYIEDHARLVRTDYDVTRRD